MRRYCRIVHESETQISAHQRSSRVRRPLPARGNDCRPTRTII